MAREFDELDSERRPRRKKPVFYMDKVPVDPSRDTFEQRWAPVYDPIEQKLREPGPEQLPRGRFAEKNPDEQPYDRLPPSLNKPMKRERLKVAQGRDLDRRTPPPLPIVPSPALSPHNPNPPGGGPYTIKPGEKLGDLQPMMQVAGAADEKPKPPLPIVPSPPIVPRPKEGPGLKGNEPYPPRGWGWAGGKYTMTDEPPPEAGQQYAEASPRRFKLPEGAILEPQEGPSAPKRFQLPEGAVLEKPKEQPKSEGAATRFLTETIPSALAAVGQVPRALATGARFVGSAADAAIGNLNDIMTRAVETGDISPKEFLEAGTLLNPTTAVTRNMALSIANMARPRNTFTTRNVRDPALAQQQIETGVMSIPKVAESGQVGQAMGRAVAGAPLGGGKLREASEAATAELQAAGTAAATRPTGTLPTQNLAGAGARSSIERTNAAAAAEVNQLRQQAQEAATRGQQQQGVSQANLAAAAESRAAGNVAEANRLERAAIRQATVATEANERAARALYEAGQVKRLSPQAMGLLRNSNEDIIGGIAKMAADIKHGANINTLAEVRKAIGPKEWLNVQGALIHRMGQGSQGQFDPATWLRNYGSLSQRGKNVLYGQADRSGLRVHLDAIEAVSRRAPTWEQFSGAGRGTLGGKMGAATLLGGAVGATVAPLTVLGTIFSGGVLARWLARPATAASVAQWSRAYERYMRASRSPNAVAAFKLATENLGNMLEAEGEQDEQPVEP